jgi:RNA polymerase sigma-70 factor (ECF subfamily)
MAESDKNSGEWLAAARAGSGEALGLILQSCRQYLLLVAGQELDADLHAKAGASDLVQETFLEAQRDFARFQGTSEAELLAWLRQILVNNVANFTRRYRTGKREVNREVGLQANDSAQASGIAGPALPDPMRTPSSEAVEREQAAALQRALERLPEDYRQVLALRYLEGRTFEEIAPLMNRSAEAARKLFARAMQRLRQEWEGSL